MAILEPLSIFGRGVNQYPLLPPQEQSDVLREVQNIGTGGLQWLGETLDKPGRAIRGLLSGNPSELLNLIPFSDTLGITDPSQSVSGRDLLQRYGLVGENEVGKLDAGDVAGFAAEIALDPLTFINPFGALTKGGRLAKAVGANVKGQNKYRKVADLLAERAAKDPDIAIKATEAAAKMGVPLADLASQKAGGAFGFTFPGLGEHVPELAQTDAMRSLDAFVGGLGGLAGRAVANAPIVGPGLAALGRSAKNIGTAMFDTSVQGMVDPLKQQVARLGTEAFERSRPESLKKFTEMLHEMEDLSAEYGKFGVAPETVARTVQNIGETRNAGKAFGRMMPGVTVPPSLAGRTEDLAKRMQGIQNTAAGEFLAAGGDMNLMNQNADFAHFFRQTTGELNKGRRTGDARLLKKSGGSGALARTAAAKFIDAETVNEMLTDSALLIDPATGKMRSSAEISAALESPAGKYHDSLVNATSLRGPTATLKEEADGMAKFLVARGDKWLKSGEKYYNADIVSNIHQYEQSLNRATKNIHAIHDYLKDNLVSGGAGTMPVADAFKNIGLDESAAQAFFARKFGPNALTKSVPVEIVEATKALQQKYTSPEWQTMFLDGYDKLLSITRGMLTVPFLSHHVRNFTSGQWMNAASHEIRTAEDMGDYLRAAKLAAQMAKNPGAARDIIDEMIINRAIPLEAGAAATDAIASRIGVPVPARGLENMTPGIGQFRAVKDVAMKNIPAAYKQRRAAGHGRVRSALGGVYQGIMEKGEDAAKQVEWMNRVPMYLYLRKKGFSPEVAGRRVRELQVDYSDLTPFERGVMKRTVLFYTYARKNMPELIRNLIRRPGGFAGQTVRASNIGREDNDFIPSYVGEGMSMPLPSGSYLSQLGLPTDQLGEYFVRGPTVRGTVRRMSQKLASQLNPLLKLGIEQTTGINLFTGRPIEELHQFPTYDPGVNLLLGDSPLSRVMSVARTIGDPRKSAMTKLVNLTTGARITDVSGGLERQKMYAQKKLLDEMLRGRKGIKSFSQVYPVEDAQLDPETMRLYQAYKGIVAEQRKDRK